MPTTPERPLWLTILLGIGALVIAFGVFVLGWSFTPGGREAREHVNCMEREMAKIKADPERLNRTLRQGQSTRADVRAFLKKTYPHQQVLEYPDRIDAGLLEFDFDDHDVMLRVLTTVPCPVV